MNHFMLPESETGQWGNARAKLRYGNFGMQTLVNDIIRQGGRRNRLAIKLSGGACLIAKGTMIGHHNADFVATCLEPESMPAPLT
jgi:chemotaxis protein CheD